MGHVAGQGVLLGHPTRAAFTFEVTLSSAVLPSRVIVTTVLILSVIGLAWVLIQIRSVLVLLALGIVFAAAIEPIVFRLRRSGLRRGQAILVVYALLIGLVGGGLYLLVPQLISQFEALDKAIPTIFDNLRQQALDSGNDLVRRTGYQTLWRIENTYTRIRNSPQIGGDQARVAASSVLGILFAVVSLMIVAFYWMTEKASIKRIMLGLFPLDRRGRAHAIWDEIEYRIGGWTRGQLLLMTIIGVCSGLAYYAIDLRFWLALAIWAGLTEAIPFIGPFIGGGTAALIALADSPQKALIVVIFAVVLQQIEGAFLVPRIMKNAVGMSPLTVILSVLIGSSLTGPTGAILAIPIGAAVQVLVSNLLRVQDDRIASELRTMDVAPLSAAQFGSPFARKRSLLHKSRDRGSEGVPRSRQSAPSGQE